MIKYERIEPLTKGFSHTKVNSKLIKSAFSPLFQLQPFTLSYLKMKCDRPARFGIM